MKTTSTTHRARLRLPGTAALANSSHGIPNVMPPPKPLRRILTGLAAALTLGLFALPGVSRADTVPTWTITSDTTWTSTSGGTGDGLLTVTDWGHIGYGAVLNQTGGKIDLSNSQYGIIIGQTQPATYNMSGNAILLSNHVLLGNGLSSSDVATWSLTDTASVVISPCPSQNQPGDLWFGQGNQAAGTRHLLLSGAASFTVTSLSFNNTGTTAGNMNTISFATGSTATFTAGNKVLADYQALVTAGNIRVDGVQQTNFSKFQVTGTGGHTLSLVPLAGPAIVATGSPLSAMSTIQGTASTATSFSVSGANMTAGITVTPPAGLEVSTTSATSDFAGSGTAITVGSAGTIAATTVWLRLAATAPVGTYNSQNIVLTSAGADTVNVTTATTGNNVTGPATKLAFTTQPGGGAVGAVWAAQPVVKVQDADGNTVNSSDSITLAITTGTPVSGGPGTLSVTTTLSAVHGVATFSGLSIDTVGAGYQLTATSAGLAPATSATFTVHVNADTRTTWSVNANTTWTSTSGSYGNGFLTVTDWGQIGNGAVLNQTGGTIDMSSSSGGMIIAQTQLGTYNMSGNAIYLSNHVLLGNNASGTWTLTDTASVTISPANGQLGDLSFGRASEAADAGKSRYLLLSGAASFTVTSLVFGKTDDDYISFATGSTATFTAGNMVLADYQALVTAGNIRVDGVQQTNFSKFQVTGNTLSLGSGAGSYTTWALAQTPPLNGEPSTVGPDGIPNLVVYALNNLNTKGTNGSPATLAGRLLSFAKRPAAVTNNDVTYAIETSPNLQNPWTIVTPDADTSSTISYTLPAGQGKIFARLVVTRK